ncbi:hypothetical protein RUND412_009420 [Rhizina undulata]
MASSKPSKRTSMRAKVARTSSTTTAISALPTKAKIQPTKKDKLQARHSSFVSKIEKSSQKSSSRSRRRKKAAESLITGLESLAAALPDDAISQSVNFQSGSSKISAGDGVGKNSMKSRPGAMKRKEKVVKSEIERFGKNLAIMATGLPGQEKEGQEKESEKEGAKKPSTWAALRGFIEVTMEKKKEFLKAEESAGKMEI